MKSFLATNFLKMFKLRACHPLYSKPQNIQLWQFLLFLHKSKFYTKDPYLVFPAINWHFLPKRDAIDYSGSLFSNALSTFSGYWPHEKMISLFQNRTSLHKKHLFSVVTLSTIQTCQRNLSCLQYRNFMIFLLLTFYVKSILGNVKVKDLLMTHF